MKTTKHNLPQAIDSHLQSIEKELTPILAALTTELRVAELSEPFAYIMSLGGKRLRPALMLMACQIFTDDLTPALRPAIGLEVFHNFSLVHDDIMDKAPIRRGKATVHHVWNDNIALLLGDTMLIKSYDYFTELQPTVFKQAFEVFNKAALEVCIGQQMDMNFETRDEVRAQEYLEMISLKTSVLIAAALKIGAIIGRASEAEVDLLYEFGLNLGLSFQVQDDILDVYGDPEVFGKAIGGDILANKKTFLLIRAMELAQGETRDELQHWLSVQTYEPQSKIVAVTNIYNQLNLLTLTEALREEFYDKALEALAKLELKMQESAHKLIDLRNFAHWLLRRNY
ncbi:MAG: hypothetical protein RIS47_1371 [Bacteroidota bacterium]